LLDLEKAARESVWLGKSRHLTIRRRSLAGTIDHFAIEIERFNKDSVIQDLKQRAARLEKRAMPVFM
jgi:hypothetical protein